MIVGLGSVFLGVTDFALGSGLVQTAGLVLLLLGIGIFLWGVFGDPPEDPQLESMPDPLPGRLCDHCGKMTSLESSNCEHCGASLIDAGPLDDTAPRSNAGL